MRVRALSLISLVLLAGCGPKAPAGPVRHYTLTGKVLAFDKQRQTATIDAAAIPHYMEAMTMEYPVKNTGELASLHTGEKITATLDVAADDTYALTGIKPQQPTPPGSGTQ